ncbi:putative mucin-like protein [Phytophthora cinnamomi]|uniref:putative mucin-like protein n=1 Tax=Phytophthora cinnamomi TaxID=4785 RepID=UPI003559F03C|nr:putative mucin-like protein [Phytophthora cinnamomi]
MPDSDNTMPDAIDPVPTPIPVWIRPTPAPTTASVGLRRGARLLVRQRRERRHLLPNCSGSGASPAGTLCPVKGDTAIADCYPTTRAVIPAVLPVHSAC